jgi:serine protease Do
MEQNKTSLFVTLLVALLAGAAAGVGGAYWLIERPLRIDSLPPIATSSTMIPPVVMRSQDEEQTIEVARRTSPAVVAITITKEIDPRAQRPQALFPDFLDDPFSQFFRTPAAPAPSAGEKQRVVVGGGSGFFVSQDGYIVTNKHVVSETNAEYTVITTDQKKHSAKVLALDPTLDLAILKVEGTDFPFLQLGNSDELIVGQSVIAIGNALAEFQNTVTKGVVSGLNRRLEAGSRTGTEVIEQAIQTDAAINFGNSGGPLLDLRGRVIGVNTAISEGGQSLGFALPSNVVAHALESVRKNGKIVRPWLGIRYVQIDEELKKKNNLAYDYGVLIIRGNTPSDLAIIPGSPADKAGLTENDIVLEFNGIKLDGIRSLSAIIAGLDPGQKVSLKIAQKGTEKMIEVTLEERKETKN